MFKLIFNSMNIKKPIDVCREHIFYRFLQYLRYCRKFIDAAKQTEEKSTAIFFISRAEYSIGEAERLFNKYEQYILGENK